MSFDSEFSQRLGTIISVAGFTATLNYQIGGEPVILEYFPVEEENDVLNGGYESDIYIEGGKEIEILPGTNVSSGDSIEIDTQNYTVRDIRPSADRSMIRLRLEDGNG